MTLLKLLRARSSQKHQILKILQRVGKSMVKIESEPCGLRDPGSFKHNNSFLTGKKKKKKLFMRYLEILETVISTALSHSLYRPVQLNSFLRTLDILTKDTGLGKEHQNPSRCFLLNITPMLRIRSVVLACKDVIGKDLLYKCSFSSDASNSPQQTFPAMSWYHPALMQRLQRQSVCLKFFLRL